MRWSGYYAFVCAIVLLACAAVPRVAAQITDPNAPYEDAYDVLTRGRLVGTWHGTISGSSISQGDRQLAGQAVFVRRGYEGRNVFALVLHDQRHRKDLDYSEKGIGGIPSGNGLDYSEISIGNIPCGPNDGVIRAVSPVEMRNAPAGAYASVNFINRLADTGRDDMVVGVGGGYGAELKNPANLQTRWTDESFSLRLSGPFISTVLPVRNHTFDYERQREGYIDRIHLDVEFTLENTPETQAEFNMTFCEEPEVFEVVQTEPLSGRENVILEGADFFVEFSDAIAEGSLDSSTVTMTTRGPDGGLIFVDLGLGLEDKNGIEDDTSLRIAPREGLRSGTIYEISIAGGESGVRGRGRQVLEGDYTFTVSTMVDPEDLQFGIYQVTRNAPLVHGKPAAARIQVDWEELDDIHPDWQVLEYLVRAEVLDERDNAVFPDLQRRLERPDQFTDEDRRLGEHTLNLFGWTPSRQRDPRKVRAEIWPDNHYPEDVEIAPDVAELTLDYAAEHIAELRFDYYIAEHSEWRTGVESGQVSQVVQAARQDQQFANQILPVARVRGRFQGSYNLRDWICGIPGAGWWVCDGEGFSLYDDKGNPARQAADYNEWDALVRLFHEHLAAGSDADILVSYHPPSMGGTGTTRAPFEQSEALRRSGDEPYWFGDPDPAPLDSLHADQTGQNTIIISTFTPGHVTRPGTLASPLVAHEFGHVFGLPHTPYARDSDHKHEICQAGYKTTAPGIDGMRIALDGADGWQKSSEHGNAQTRKILLNLMFPCIYEPHADYWIDGNQYNWLIERMPAMLRYTRGRRAEAPVFSRVRFAQLSDDGVRSDAAHDLADARWIMLSGVADGTDATLLPAVGLAGERRPLGANGPYELRVEGVRGELLARASVGPDPLIPGPWPFAVAVAVSGDPVRIALLRDGKVVAERRSDPSLAAPVVTSHATGATYRSGEVLAWDGGQRDGLTYSLRYSANGQDWTTLAVMLAEPRFAPHPSTLMPGLGTAFEIIAYDGVTERSTRLPVEVDVPLVPLSVWAEESGGIGARIAFNVPLDQNTLGDIALETGGKAVPATVALNPSGTVLAIAPHDRGDGGDYTVTVPTTLRAEDGRSLGQEISFSFSVQAAPTTVSEAVRQSGRGAASDPASSLADGSESPEDSKSPPEPEPVGNGEITLVFGKTITVPARVLRCETEDDGDPSLLVLDFETDPGDRVETVLTRDGENAFAVEMTLSNGVILAGQATIEDRVPSRSETEVITARGHIGDAPSRSEFAFTGQCPSL
ncbi:hypothetical protein QO034_19435 [Sedimentitalea sp. JM2-8]|uniref:Ig-like domain-containing protein n=1 Tax=Sedimentitalea xiamensis TaxID=3050037 RepID=A0ABT7FJE6_9RHOB|nr:hypothetical protein [Sedimentitalea xiamensis]MDK3075263.1 hypothetical protein [Sedimentitalea xiamensis]